MLRYSCLLFIVTTLLCCIQCLSETIQRKDDQVVARLQKILAEPVFSPELRNGKLTHHSSSKQDEIQFDISNIKKKSSLLGYCKIDYRDGKCISYDIGTDAEEEYSSFTPNWIEIYKEYNQFISKYWPYYTCNEDINVEMRRFQPGRGVFTLRYVLLDHELIVSSVFIDIRLGDGKIASLYFIDNRYLCDGIDINSPPTKEKLQVKIKEALASKIDIDETIDNMSFVKLHRDIRVDRNGGRHLVDGYDARIITNKKRHLVVVGNFYERENVVNLENIYDEKILDERMKAPLKPLLDIADTVPACSMSQDNIWFTTTRKEKDFPWWKRYGIVTTPAIYDRIAKKIFLVNTIKTTEKNILNYSALTPSPTGRFIAMICNKQLVISDIKEGTTYFPDRDKVWRKQWHDIGLSESEISQNEQWQVHSMCWLPDEQALLLSMNKDRDVNIYLSQKENPDSIGSLTLTPLVRDIGDDLCPVLDRDGNKLGYFNHNLIKDTWSFVEAIVDLKLCTVKTKRNISLEAEPKSLSWDPIHGRWLVVINNKMVWIISNEKELVCKIMDPLFWDKIELIPQSAAIAGVGKEIIFSAGLKRPAIDEKNEMRVKGVLFVWDGVSSKVEPLFNPFLEEISRYKFLTAGSEWTKVKGNLKCFPSAQFIDPITISDQLLVFLGHGNEVNNVYGKQILR